MKNQETRMNDMNDTVSTSLWRRRTVLGALGAAPVAVTRGHGWPTRREGIS